MSYNTIKSTKIQGTNNISGYSLDVSGNQFISGNLDVSGNISTSQTTFSGQNCITKTYADATYLAGGSSGILSNNNAFTGSNTFGVAGQPNVTTLTINSNTNIANDVYINQAKITNSLVVPSISQANYLSIQPVSGNVGIGSNQVPTHKLQVTGDCLITDDLTVDGLTINNSALQLGDAYFNIAIGSSFPNAVFPNCQYNVAFNTALSGLTTGAYNFGVGYNTLTECTTGSFNTAIGASALENTVGSTSNTALGNGALKYLTTGNYNTAISTNAGLNNNTGSNNTYIGYQAGINDLGSNNVCIGVNTGPIEDDLTIYTNSVAIGKDVPITASNQINIGTAADTVNILGLFNAPYLIPVGTIIAHAASQNITGYLLCNGQAVSRTTYEDLFNLLDITYGPGNGVETFNVPNYKGLFHRGLGFNNLHAEYAAAGIGVQQQQQIITHTHLSPSNPNLSYVGSGSTTTVLSDATVNQPIIEFPALTVGLGTLNLGALGSYNLGNITIQIPSVTVQTVLSKTNATVISGLNNSTFATNTGSLSTSTVSNGTETRPGNMGVYYFIKI